MSDLPDPSPWRLLEHIGPWVGNLGGLIAGFIAGLQRIRREMKETSDDLRKLRRNCRLRMPVMRQARALDDINGNDESAYGPLRPMSERRTVT